MARPQSYDSATLAELTLSTFWSHGYSTTSMDDLVQATGVSRHGIYKEFGGKKGAFLAAFDTYQDLIVSPAFGRVERAGATLRDIAAYFEQQIALAERTGLPGLGCFVANAATEMAGRDADVRHRVLAHNDRLRRGFLNAIRNAQRGDGGKNTPGNEVLADITVVFTTGLWSHARIVSDASDLRHAVDGFMALIKGQSR